MTDMKRGGWWGLAIQLCTLLILAWLLMAAQMLVSAPVIPILCYRIKRGWWPRAKDGWPVEVNSKNVVRQAMRIIIMWWAGNLASTTTRRT